MRTRRSRLMGWTLAFLCLIASASCGNSPPSSSSAAEEGLAVTEETAIASSSAVANGYSDAPTASVAPPAFGTANQDAIGGADDSELVPPQEPEIAQAHAAVEPHYESVEGMTRAASVVVKGRIVSAEPGPILGEEPGRLRLQELTIIADEVLAGRGPNELVVYELAWNEYGNPVEVNGIGPSQSGEAGIFFLQEADGAGYSEGFVWLGSQGRFVQVGEDQLNNDKEGDKFSQDTAALGLKELSDQIRQSARAGDIDN